MSEQTVSLKLTGDTEDIQQALRETADAMDNLSGKAESAAEDIESSVSGASSAWDDHSGAINAAAAAMGAAGAAMEGFARSQQDATVDLQRVSTATGIQSDALRDLAADTANVTFGTEDVIGTFHALGRQGVDTEADLHRVANVWDLVADATGENVVQLAEGSVALRTLGIDAREPERALDAFGFITTQTTGSVQEFLQFVERTGPELRDLNLDVNDTAALMGVLENEFGMTGRTARQEFRSAVNESNGDLGTLLETLGITPGQFEAMRGSVEGSSQALHDNAEALEASFTPLQRLSSWVEETALRYGGLSDAAGMLSPVLMGGGGLIFSVNQMATMKARWATNTATATTRMRGLTATLGPLALAMIAVADGVNQYQSTLAEFRTETEETQRTFAEFNREVVDGELTWDSAKDSFLEFMLPWRQVSTGLAEWQHGFELLTGSIEDTADAAPELTAEVANLTDAEMSARQHIAAANDVIDRQADSQDEASSAAERHADAFQELMDRQREAVDPVFALERAMQRYDDVSNDAEATSWDVARAISDLERAAMDGDLSFGDFDRKLDGWIRTGHLTEKQADDIRDSVHDMRGEADKWAGEYEATFRMRMDVSQADLNMADRWTRQAEAATRAARGAPGGATSGASNLNTADTRNLLRERAEGGPVWPGEWFLVGEQGPEIAHFPAHGEVFSAPETAQMLRGGDGASVQATINVVANERVIGSSDVTIDAMTGAVRSRQRDLGLV